MWLFDTAISGNIVQLSAGFSLLYYDYVHCTLIKLCVPQGGHTYHTIKLAATLRCRTDFDYMEKKHILYKNHRHTTESSSGHFDKWNEVLLKEILAYGGQKFVQFWDELILSSNHPGKIHSILRIVPMQNSWHCKSKTEATTFAFSSVYILLLCFQLNCDTGICVAGGGIWVTRQILCSNIYI